MDAPTTPGFPERIGRYRLLELVGSGGMGTVYRAHDPQLDRVVALKVPHRREAPDELGFAQRFAREARAAARVLHPNVCPIFDVGEHDGVPFVVMAFVEGRALSYYLPPGERHTVEEAVRVVWQVLDALAAVHAAGIIHRDVKPGNILITPTGQAILTDFGLARPEGESLLTSDGVILGTPSYMAPEQAAGNVAEVGPWTDLYAVGVVLFHMLTGRLPFAGTKAEVMAAVLRDDPPALRDHCPEAGPDLEAVVRRAMAKRPAERFRDAGAFAQALAGVGTGELGATTVAYAGDASAPQPKARRGADWSRWAVWLLGALLAALLGAGLAGIVFAIIQDRERPWEGNRAGLVGLTVTMGLVGLLWLHGVCLLWDWVELAYSLEGLLFSAKRGWTGCIQRAAANGVPLDEANENGETALMIATQSGQVEAVKALLLLGASTKPVNAFNQTAAEVAWANGQGAIHDMLARAASSPHPSRYATRTRARLPGRLILSLSCSVESLYPAAARSMMLWVSTRRRPSRPRAVSDLARSADPSSRLWREKTLSACHR